jgi:hypothetical protein
MISGLRRYSTEQTNPQHLSHSNITPKVFGKGVRRTFLAEICDTGRTGDVGIGRRSQHDSSGERNLRRINRSDGANGRGQKVERS